MLARKMRVSKEGFKKLKNKGKIYHGSILSLRVVFLEKNTPQRKFSFIVSKKVSKHATKRNLLKRCGFGVIMKHLDRIAQENAYFFYFKKSSTIPSFHEIESEIIMLLQKSGKIKV